MSGLYEYPYVVTCGNCAAVVNVMPDAFVIDVEFVRRLESELLLPNSSVSFPLAETPRPLPASSTEVKLLSLNVFDDETSICLLCVPDQLVEISVEPEPVLRVW